MKERKIGVVAELDWKNTISAENGQHAHHTGWAMDPSGECFVLTLHDEDDNTFAFASYDYDAWMDVFENLKAAKKLIDEKGVRKS
jgi:hypothetical protein